jgi:AcrR family transcriptional regulator
MMDAVPAIEAEGLRERKKRATQDAIERAAVELALAHGYENVTVEMICDVATISQRTFFNYAGSKERAVLGAMVPLPDRQLRASFVSGLGGGGVLDDLVATLAVSFAGLGETQGDLLQKRRQVLQANPELALKEFARMEEAEESILELVRERLIHDGLAPRDLNDRANMVVSLTFGIMHYVARAWMETGYPDDIRGVLTRAADLARQVAAG